MEQTVNTLGVNGLTARFGDYNHCHLQDDDADDDGDEDMLWLPTI